jgi:hypothetical protein
MKYINLICPHCGGEISVSENDDWQNAPETGKTTGKPDANADAVAILSKAFGNLKR